MNTLIENINWTTIIGIATVVLVGIIIPVVMIYLDSKAVESEEDLFI